MKIDNGYNSLFYKLLFLYIGSVIGVLPVVIAFGFLNTQYRWNPNFYITSFITSILIIILLNTIIAISAVFYIKLKRISLISDSSGFFKAGFLFSFLYLLIDRYIIVPIINKLDASFPNSIIPDLFSDILFHGLFPYIFVPLILFTIILKILHFKKQ